MNLPDGRVEVHVEGQRDAVTTMLAELHDGPPAGRVHRVETAWEPPVGATGFAIG